MDNSAAEEPALKLLASYAYKERKNIDNRYKMGEGLVGQCALEKGKILLTNVPSNYIKITSGLGRLPPLNIIVMPIVFEGMVKAVMELASFDRFNPTHETFLDQLCESIGIVLNTIEANMRTEDLLKQSQSLARELQSQQEELQQTNAELEDKAKLLAEQNSEVERKNREVEQARQALEEKAKQLALTSKYKSEFLANMSHELRTPLNSLLILSDQLSKNGEGNLTTKQVDFARTIHSSGNDLLALINDILDLSKIESGTVIVDIGDITFRDLQDYVGRTFRHVAESKRLEFGVELADGVPRGIHTDALPITADSQKPVVQRVQIYRAAVTSRCVSIPLPRAGRATTKRSTGHRAVVASLGAGHRHRHPPGEAADHLRGFPTSRRLDQPQVRRHRPGPGDQPRAGQAAGRRNSSLQQDRRRKHLHALPAADVQRSAQHSSSAVADANRRRNDANARRSGNAGQSYVPRREPTPAAASTVEDDSGDIQSGDRVVLVVENDANFAKVLLDVAHEHGLKAVVVSRGSAALSTARELKPHAVTLDINLPDIDGWRVLDRLKDDPDTRHIPVHMISTEEERGDAACAKEPWSALVKPLKTKQSLDEAFNRIKDFIEPRTRRVLVAQGDSNTRAQVTELLTGNDVAVGSVPGSTEALSTLKEGGIDLIVIDPDLSRWQRFRPGRRNPRRTRTCATCQSSSTAPAK